ncbi:Nn.00g045860.m01.CDS01 [Neocucurbitaria sp. VM-36]
MVLSVLIAVITAPGLLGSQEAIRQSQSKEKREEHRARRCNLIATCVKSSQRSREINGRPIVLRDGKLWVDTGTEDGSPCGHPYAGYYLPYPDSKYEGLVTTITDVAPIMNWIYIDKNTHEIKYGVRADAQPNLTGPFDCTRQDRRLTFDGWEGWCAVEEYPGQWSLYFDVDDDGLQAKIAPGTKVLEIELSRKEKKFVKETVARQQDQTTKRAINADEDTPVELPLAAEELVQHPGVVDITSSEQKNALEAPSPFKIPESIFGNSQPMGGAQGMNSQPKSFGVPDSMPDDPPSIGARSLEGKITPQSPPPAYSITMSPGEDSGSPLGANVHEDLDKSSSPNIKQDGRRVDSSPPANANTRPTAERPSVLTQSNGSKRTTRASSNASSSSNYSNRGRTPMPLPLAIPKAKTLPERPRGSEKMDTNLRAKPSLRRPAIPPGRKVPSNITDPAIFGENSLNNLRSSPQSRRSNASRGSGTPRSSAQQPVSRPDKSTSTTRLRQDTNKNQSPFLNQSRIRASSESSPYNTTTRPARKYPAGTKTTEQDSKGKVNRVIERREKNLPGASLSRTPQRRKTTSALFRELDLLVSQDVSISSYRSANIKLSKRSQTTLDTGTMGKRKGPSRGSSDGKIDASRRLRVENVRRGLVKSPEMEDD